MANVPPDITGFSGDFYYSLGDFLNLNCSTHNVSLIVQQLATRPCAAHPPFSESLKRKTERCAPLRHAHSFCRSFWRDCWYFEKILQKIPVWEKIRRSGIASLIVISFNNTTVCRTVSTFCFHLLTRVPLS